MKTDLTITTTSATDNKKVTNKISYVNPNLNNNQAIELAQAITDLTTDSYLKTTRTDTTECDTTNSRPITNILYNKAGSPAYAQVPADGVITMTTNEVYSNGLRIYIETPYDGQAPIVSDITDDSNTPVGLEQISWAGAMYGTGNPRNKWGIAFTNSIQTSQRNITPRTVTFKVTFKPTYQYDAWEKTFTFNITEGE